MTTAIMIYFASRLKVTFILVSASPLFNPTPLIIATFTSFTLCSSPFTFHLSLRPSHRFSSSPLLTIIVDWSRDTYEQIQNLGEYAAERKKGNMFFYTEPDKTDYNLRKDFPDVFGEHLQVRPICFLSLFVFVRIFNFWVVILVFICVCLLLRLYFVHLFVWLLGGFILYF